MKTKIRNVLILLLGILVLGVIFNTNQVRAVEITKEQAQSMLDLIPDEIEINIPEVEVEKAEEKVKSEVDKIWSKNNISTEGLKIQYIHYYYLGKEYTSDSNFYKITIQINNFGLYKNISIKYNNSSKWNEADNTYVKNLNIKPAENTYYEWKTENAGNKENWENFVGNYYTKLINDKSIIVKAISGAGGGEFLGGGFERIYFNTF